MTVVHATAEDVRQGIADNLESIPGILISPYMTDPKVLPAVQVMRGPIEYDLASGGGVNMWTFLVRVFVADVLDIAASSKLDAFLSVDGLHSVKAAIEADPQLGGMIQDLHVTSATGETVFVRDSGGPTLGSEWTVEVWL